MTDKLTVEVTAWKPLERGTLQGFVEVHFPALRLRVSDITVHKHESGKMWCGLPGKPRLDRDGNLVRAASGKVEYSPVLSWDCRAVSDAFSAKVIEALEAFRQREPE